MAMCRATSVLLTRKIGVSYIVTCCASSSRKIVLREKMRLLLMMCWRKGAEMRALTQNLSVEEIDTLSNASINDEGNSNKGKKRKNSSDSSDAFHEAAIIIGTKIEEATDKFSRALGVDLDIALKRDKINEELCKLSNL